MHRLLLAPLVLLRPVAEAVAWWQVRRSPQRREEWLERLGKALLRPPTGGIWVHGASVGEARLLALLSRGIRERAPQIPVYVSCVTPSGRKVLPSPPDVDAAFVAPLDLPGLPRRWLARLRPQALALLEAELWPVLVREANAQGVPVVLVNARLPQSRLRRYRRLAFIYRPVLDSLAAVGAQSEEDARRFVELGAREERVQVTGNLKFALPAPARSREEARRRLGVDDETPVLAAASTHAGEESAFFEAARAAASAAGAQPILLVAPRHLHRADEVEAEALRRGYAVARLSAGAAPPAPGTVLLVDTLGELPELLPAADVAFVGGSLVPRGGHNVLEPASAGIPVIFGPHVEHIREPAEALVRRGGGRCVADPKALAETLSELLASADTRRSMGEAARGVARSHAGALDRTLDLLEAVLGPSRPLEPAGARTQGGSA